MELLISTLQCGLLETKIKHTNKYLLVATISQKYFGTLLLFLTVSFHQKCIRTRLLSPKIEIRMCLGGIGRGDWPDMDNII